jgi:hypothetical protein
MRAAHLPDHAGDIRRRLTDPRKLCDRLGLTKGSQPQSHGLLICCPWHEDSTPSCSVRVAGDGTIAVNCFACDASGDALSLIAKVHGLSAVGNFQKVLEVAAELADTTLVEAASRPAPPPQSAPPARDYPPADEVAAFWSAARPVIDDAEVGAWLRVRDLDPAAVEAFDLARALPSDAALPRWARTRQFGSWIESGHRCLVPLFDETGAMRSVRARRILSRDDGGPKALPPAGHRLSGLIMACPLARQLLALGRHPDFWPARADLVIVVAEGEPDYLKWATGWPEENLTAPGVFGVVAGSWSPAIAARIPDNADVCIWTHNDQAGDKYADQVIRTLEGRVTLRRGQPE